MLELKNISKTFHTARTQLTVLQDINLNVKPGEIYGLLGRSGAGKSTLLRCINLLTRPSTGQIFVNQIELTNLPDAKLRTERQKIGMIFQHFNLLNSRSVFDNVALPLEIMGDQKAVPKRVPEVLSLVGLSHKLKAFPAELSGGQKQRVAIARALSVQPRILLSDEATSSLDTESTQSILNLLKKINQELGLTIFLISHELEVVKTLCDRVGILDHGKLIEEGTTVEIFAKPKASLTQQLVSPKIDIKQLNVVHKDNVKLLKLTFFGQESEQPIISSLIRKFDIDINILQADINTIQNTTVGYTICEITGEKHQWQALLEYLATTSIIAEVLHV